MEKTPEPRPWLDPRIEVASSSIEGRGLFAREPIAAGETVVRLRGEKLTSEHLAERIAALPRYSALASDDDLHLLIADDSPANFGNHSCDGNLWMVDAVTLAARRPITAGEEVTVDQRRTVRIWRGRCPAPVDLRTAGVS